MVQKNITVRQEAAKLFLQNPAMTATEAGSRLNLNSSMISAWMREEHGPQGFLERYGGELATDAAIADVIAGGLRNQHKTAERNSKARDQVSKSAAAIAASKKPKQRLLGAHECQWLISADTFCCKEVTGLYCAEHEAIAKEPEIPPADSSVVR